MFRVLQAAYARLAQRVVLLGMETFWEISDFCFASETLSRACKEDVRTKSMDKQGQTFILSKRPEQTDDL